MKLYFSKDHHWQVPGKQPHNAERVVLPSSPAEMAAWLAERGVTPRGLADSCPKCGDRPAIAGEIAESQDIGAITDWILDQATPAQVEQLFAALGARFHETRTQLADERISL